MLRIGFRLDSVLGLLLTKRYNGHRTDPLILDYWTEVLDQRILGISHKSETLLSSRVVYILVLSVCLKVFCLRFCFDGDLLMTLLSTV